MSYRYKQAEVRDKNLLDAEQVRDGLVEQLGSLQALDRDQLPHGAVDENMIANGAMHQMLSADVNSENQPPYRFTDPAERPASLFYLPNYIFPPGVRFRTYTGGSVVLCEEDIVCKGGVIQAEFSCWTWRETIADSTDPDEVPLRYYLTLSINGRTVASSGAVAQHWSSIHLVGTAVAPEGATRVRAEWSLTPLGSGNTYGLRREVPFFAVGGTSLLIQNRRT